MKIPSADKLTHSFQAILVKISTLSLSEYDMVRRNAIIRAALVGTWLIAVTGCRQEAAPPTPALSERPGPEESFKEIVELFEDGMELPGSNLSNVFTKDTGTSSRIQVHNTVTSQLIPPANADDFYRGIITVSSQSIYSLRRAKEDNDETDDESQDNAGDGAYGGRGDSENTGSEFQSFDQGLIANAPGDEKKSETGKSPIVQRRPEKDDRTYELLYRDGRWQLITKLDPKTEASVANAFDRALSHQP